MRSEHKIWTVIQAIVDASDITPSGQSMEILPSTLEEFINATEARQIIHKLAKDEKIIEIEHDPHDIGSLRLGAVDNNAYLIRIPDTEVFQAYYDKAHFKFFGSLEKLTGEKFLAIADVAQDISEKLSMSSSNEVFIPIHRDIIRYNILCPGLSPNLMDRYCSLRMEATRYLKENGHIVDFSVTKENWDSTITIQVNRMGFFKFYRQLLEIFPKKVESKKSEKGTPRLDEKTCDGVFRFNNGVLYRDGFDNVLKFGENLLEYNLLQIAFEKEVEERIDLATEGVDFSGWKQLNDTARRLNKKIAETFHFDNFFIIENQDKHVQRSTK